MTRYLSKNAYNTDFHHDSCGVGMVCRTDGTAGRDIVAAGLEILANLAHRGASGCDESSGDGAGILIQMPHDFLCKVASLSGIALPGPGQYGCGLVFFPRSEENRDRVCQVLESMAEREGLCVLGKRRVPVDSDCLGDLAREGEPCIFQYFVAPKKGHLESEDLERKLFAVRKKIEHAVDSSSLPDKNVFHVPSLSAKTLVYKGMFLARQLAQYYPDLSDPDMKSALAIVHQRYSTNTFPSWALAQPFRLLCHNGEINTVKGNRFAMKAREAALASDKFGELSELLPAIAPDGSDSCSLDNALELLCRAGRSLPHAMLMMVPEAWEHDDLMSDELKAFYRYHACLMEPWDGPAAICFTDGNLAGAMLDRNGLRPCRYTVTRDGLVVMASETGVIDIPSENVLRKGRVRPGQMFLADLSAGKILEDGAIKEELARRRPYGQWLKQNMVAVGKSKETAPPKSEGAIGLDKLQAAFGYTREDFKFILEPMISKGKEPVGSMGDDAPPAILSKRTRLLYDYFKQLFAQVTNPPLDSIREKLVTSLMVFLGPERNLLEETPEHCRRVSLESPILSHETMDEIKEGRLGKLASRTLSLAYPAGGSLAEAISRLASQASKAADGGSSVIVLSDRGVDEEHFAIPALLGLSAVHHHLIEEGKRCRCSLVVDSGEPREVHHFCCLLGFGADAVHPYLTFETIRNMVERRDEKSLDYPAAAENYVSALESGILKVMGKMGISTLRSYRGAQMFECVGIDSEVIDRYFTGTASRIGGADLKVLETESKKRFEDAFLVKRPPGSRVVPSGGKYQWRMDGEARQYNPEALGLFRKAIFGEDRDAWKQFSALVDGQNRREGLIRGLLEIVPKGEPIPLEEVEPWTEIVKRFKTGAMSYGSISQEAHEALAVAMNRIGGRSNSGEGGEDADRFLPDENGDWRNSAIKQVASGRFGVTGAYLGSARELQIKMAQGAKPGEGGQLPGFKVYPWIAKTRHSTPYVGLISPPPHHDIYSIEDLAQLIHDLKCANTEAKVSVKLVSAAGVGAIAAGVAKAGADLILISGDAGGTGASPLGSIRYGGVPWELGLPEAHVCLAENGLRDRVVLETDGQLKTGRDVAVACMLGAEEFGFGTIALIALGCIMMRVCHLNTCPVGIATQDPELRKKFAGKPEHVVTLMRFIAEELREIMAQAGFRNIDEMVGKSENLRTGPALAHWKAHGLDIAPLLRRPEIPAGVATHCTVSSVKRPDLSFDEALLEKARPALERGEPVVIDTKIRNIYRSVGAMLSGKISALGPDRVLPDDTVVIRCRGTAGQSFFAFGAKGITVDIVGDANDYLGKGLCGAKLIVRPPDIPGYEAEKNIIAGNVAFYGATSGEAYIRGVVGERFCVRNSGVHAVVEGTGDHACEYMTGGRVAILGRTGRNAAAGMSGGVAYVYDPDGDFKQRCNTEMVELGPFSEEEDEKEAKSMIEKHLEYTGSPVAREILDNWEHAAAKFVKVMPVEYKKALGLATLDKIAT